MFSDNIYGFFCHSSKLYHEYATWRVCDSVLLARLSAQHIGCSQESIPLVVKDMGILCQVQAIHSSVILHSFSWKLVLLYCSFLCISRRAYCVCALLAFYASSI